MDNVIKIESFLQIKQEPIDPDYEQPESTSSCDIGQTDKGTSTSRDFGQTFGTQIKVEPGLESPEKPTDEPEQNAVRSIGVSQGTNTPVVVKTEAPEMLMVCEDYTPLPDIKAELVDVGVGSCSTRSKPYTNTILQKNMNIGNKTTLKDQSSFPCRFCGKTFPRASLKAEHERLHARLCKVCGKKFHKPTVREDPEMIGPD